MSLTTTITCDRCGAIITDLSSAELVTLELRLSGAAMHWTMLQVHRGCVSGLTIRLVAPPGAPLTLLAHDEP